MGHLGGHLTFDEDGYPVIGEDDTWYTIFSLVSALNCSTINAIHSFQKDKLRYASHLESDRWSHKT
jgi:hypothetical protein